MKLSRYTWPLAACASLVPMLAAADSGNMPSPLVEKIRTATAKYQDVAQAINDGYVDGGSCVSGPDGGAMGVHYINFGLVGDGGALNADTPEALMYEPTPGGGLRLVGVEYIALANGPNDSYVLQGHLLDYESTPNRYGLPSFFALHVWAWKHNPKGTFSEWNPLVSCDAEPLTSP